MSGRDNPQQTGQLLAFLDSFVSRGSQLCVYVFSLCISEVDHINGNQYPHINLTNWYCWSVPGPINLWPVSVWIEPVIFAGASEQHKLSVWLQLTEEVWIHAGVKGQVLQMKKGHREEHERDIDRWTDEGEPVCFCVCAGDKREKKIGHNQG